MAGSLQFWIIAIAVGLLWYAYSNPTGYNKLAGVAFEPLNKAIGNFNPFKGSTAPAPVTQTSTQCPDTAEPVCGNNGKTYQNICFATLEGIGSVTPGACK